MRDESFEHLAFVDEPPNELSVIVGVHPRRTVFPLPLSKFQESNPIGVDLGL